MGVGCIELMGYHWSAVNEMGAVRAMNKLGNWLIDRRVIELVSPGAVTNGVTLYIFPRKLTTFFSHRPPNLF